MVDRKEPDKLDAGMVPREHVFLAHALQIVEIFLFVDESAEG